ncbi:hypothetical protein LJC45_04205 [Alistipes sp. OttesenSCG-928-B03]|nr:hypothetical protein [Alistipes sp. OttesenSCG-928-B03]
MDQIKILIKRILSYTKKEWMLEDYPLRYRRQKSVPEDYRWAVQILNWWISGVGDTKEKALEDLVKNFNLYKENNDKLPRPGTIVPIQFADTSMIEELEVEGVDFFDKIIGMDYYSCFISDETSLHDFGMYDDRTLRKINEFYSLDLHDLEDGNIVKLLTIIRDKSSSNNAD